MSKEKASSPVVKKKSVKRQRRKGPTSNTRARHEHEKIVAKRSGAVAFMSGIKEEKEDTRILADHAACRRCPWQHSGPITRSEQVSRAAVAHALGHSLLRDAA